MRRRQTSHRAHRGGLRATRVAEAREEFEERRERYGRRVRAVLDDYFDTGNAQHHGTPEERRDALLMGYDSGEPARCSRFVSAA